MRKACVVKVMNTPSSEALDAFYKRFYKIVVEPQLKQPEKRAA